MKDIEDRTLISFDWAIKYTLRNKANFDILEGFLSALLNEDIQVTGLLESEANQWNESDKFNRVDLMVEDSQGVEFIIEVQYSYARNYLKRLLFGTSKLITDNMEAGNQYGKVKKVISISLLYFEIGDPDKDKDYIYHSHTDFYGMNSKKRLSVGHDTLRKEGTEEEKTEGETEEEAEKDTAPANIVDRNKNNIFPEYYLIVVENFPDEVKNALDEWIYFFKHSEIPDGFRAKNIQTAREKLKLIKMGKKERNAYEKFQMARASYQDEIDSAEKKGHEKGREEGREEGRAEGQLETRLEVARQMLKNGMSASNIQLCTGLSEEEIAQLRVN